MSEALLSTRAIPAAGPLPSSLQFNEEGRLRHLLTIEGLPHALITEILDTAESFASMNAQAVKKVPLLRGKTVVNLFFEASTRTRTTFELAAKRLSADVLNMNISTSATTKGESLLDTLRNLEAMYVDMFVVRHESSGAAHFFARHVAPTCRCSMPATGATPIPPRRCWTCSPSAATSRTSRACGWPSWATSCIPGWPAPRSTP